MGMIKVSTEALENANQREREFVRRMEQITRDVQNVSSRLYLNVPTISSIRTSIRNQASNVSRCGASMQKLSNVLTQSQSTYSRTEKKLTGQNGEKAGLSKYFTGVIIKAPDILPGPIVNPSVAWFRKQDFAAFFRNYRDRTCPNMDPTQRIIRDATRTILQYLKDYNRFYNALREGYWLPSATEMLRITRATFGPAMRIPASAFAGLAAVTAVQEANSLWGNARLGHVIAPALKEAAKGPANTGGMYKNPGTAVPAGAATALKKSSQNSAVKYISSYSAQKSKLVISSSPSSGSSASKTASGSSASKTASGSTGSGKTTSSGSSTGSARIIATSSGGSRTTSKSSSGSSSSGQSLTLSMSSSSGSSKSSSSTAQFITGTVKEAVKSTVKLSTGLTKPVVAAQGTISTSTLKLSVGGSASMNARLTLSLTPVK